MTRRMTPARISRYRAILEARIRGALADGVERSRAEVHAIACRDDGPRSWAPFNRALSDLVRRGDVLRSPRPSPRVPRAYRWVGAGTVRRMDVDPDGGFDAGAGGQGTHCDMGMEDGASDATS